MQHQYPFTVLYFEFYGESLDVNVHPTKMELRFDNNQEVYKALCDVIFERLSHKEMIPVVPVDDKTGGEKVVHEYSEPIPEPFETRRLNDILKKIDYPDYDKKESAKVNESNSTNNAESSNFLNSYSGSTGSKDKNSYASGSSVNNINSGNDFNNSGSFNNSNNGNVNGNSDSSENDFLNNTTKYENIKLQDISDDFLTEDAKKKHKIIGQLFKTYWLIEYEDKLFIIDQHAAHEKVLYERTMSKLKDKVFTSQTISPPIIISLDAKETEMLEKHREQIEKMGYVVESFGGKEYMISAIPDNLFHIDMKDLFIEMLDDFANISGRETPELILEKVASMSCKAAVKGNDKLSLPEIEALIDELLTLENPYNCPHGRPTIISMTKYEIEKKFKRIV